MSETYKIYVACLSAYNHGYLHGEWIDATQDEDSILAEIHTTLAVSPVVELYGEVAEEWAIHCHEGFHGIEIDEYESIATVSQLAQELEEHGEPYAAYLGYFSDGGVEDFQERYRGCFEDEEDFTYKLYEDMGAIEVITQAGFQECYIDFKAIARDLFINDYVSLGHQDCHVFSIH